jgi:hypothetical protein
MKKAMSYRLPLVVFFAALAVLMLSRYSIDYLHDRFSPGGEAADPRVDRIFRSLFSVLDEARQGRRDPQSPAVRRTREYLAEVSGIRPGPAAAGDGLKRWKSWYEENRSYFHYDPEKDRITCPFLKRSVPAPDFLPD